jgi:hypothetical protein
VAPEARPNVRGDDLVSSELPTFVAEEKSRSPRSKKPLLAL